jgi:hypothetical protein
MNSFDYEFDYYYYYFDVVVVAGVVVVGVEDIFVG